jgi:mannosyltransferase
MMITATIRSYDYKDSTMFPSHVQGAAGTKNIGFKLTRNSVIVLVLLVLGGLLRLMQIGEESYWIDEMVTIHVGRDIERVISDAIGGRPPVYMILVHYWMQLFGESETAVRLLSALFGIASLGVFYAFARYLFNESVALIGLILMSFSRLQIYHAQDARYYSVYVFMVIVATFVFVAFLKTKRTSFIFTYVAFAGLMFYSHTHGIFVIAAHVLYFLLFWRDYKDVIKPWFVAQTLLFLIILPMVYVQLTSTASSEGGVGDWLTAPGAIELARVPLHYVYIGSGTILNLVAVALSALILVGCIAVYAAKMRGSARAAAPGSRAGSAAYSVSDLANKITIRNDDRRWLVLLAFCFLCPLLIPFVLSHLLSPMFILRYTIAASPILYISIAYFFVSIKRIVPLPLIALSLAIPALPGLITYYTEPSKQQWKEAAAYIQNDNRGASVIVFTKDDWSEETFNHYYRGKTRTCSMEGQVSW